MKLELVEAEFVRREKRFFAHVKYQGEPIVAHLANTGSLKTALASNVPCWISPAKNPERKLRWTLEALRVEGCWVGVNTALANTLVSEAVAWMFPVALDCKREAVWTKETRFDFCVRDSQGLTYIEVKSVTMAREKLALFPDAVTTRGQKHLSELIEVVRQGHRAVLVFVVQREGIEAFSAAADIDPEYAASLRRALQAGVEVRVHPVQMSQSEFILAKEQLPLVVPNSIWDQEACQPEIS